MMDINTIRATVAGHGLVRSVEPLPSGPMRIETAFLYPEGSSVDLYLVEDGALLPVTRLSDLGNTMAWLLDVQVKPWLSKKRQQLLTDALRTHGVVQRGGALELPIAAMGDLMGGIVSLGQACIRASDLVYTRRSSLQVPMNENVEEIIVDANLPFETDVELDGRFGPVRVDFLVTGSRTSSAMLTLSSANSSQAHTLANEIFRKWHDLDSPSRAEQRITVFDDRSDAYKDADLRRLADKSTVIALSDRVTLEDVLRAA